MRMKISHLGNLVSAYKFRGFTLSELLMSVLVISIVMVAMAPVITKRVSDNISVADVKYEGVLFDYNTPNTSCEIVEDENGNYRQCDFDLPDGVHSINVIAVSGGGGGAGALLPPYLGVRTSNTNIRCTLDKILNYYIIPLNPNIKDFEVTLSSAGGTGGGASIYQHNGGEAPTSQFDCDPYDAIYIKPSGSSGFCVTKKNIGDLPGFNISKYANVAKEDTACTGTSCCWAGMTSANDCDITGETTNGYSGCYRTVCSYTAAKELCSNYKYELDAEIGLWSLPESTTDVYAIYSKYATTSTCTNTMNDTCPHCSKRENGCLLDGGTTYKNCFPGALWVNNTKNFIYSSNSYEVDTNSIAAASTRCVLKTLPKRTIVATGGGGASGISATIKVPNNLLEENYGGFLLMNRSNAYPAINNINKMDGTEAEIGFGGSDHIKVNENGNYISATSAFPDMDDLYARGAWGHQYINEATDLDYFKIGNSSITESALKEKLIGDWLYSTFVYIYSTNSSKPIWGAFLPNGSWGYAGHALNKKYGAGALGEDSNITTITTSDIPYISCVGRASSEDYLYPEGENILGNYIGCNVTEFTPSKKGSDGNFITLLKEGSTVQGGQGGIGQNSGGRGSQVQYKKNASSGEYEILVKSFASGYGMADFSYKFYGYFTPQGGVGGGGGQLMEIENIKIKDTDTIKVLIGGGGKGGTGGTIRIMPDANNTSIAQPPDYGSVSETCQSSVIGNRLVNGYAPGGDGQNGGKSGIIINSHEYSIEGGKSGISRKLGDKFYKLSETIPSGGKGGEAVTDLGDLENAAKIVKGGNGTAATELRATINNRVTNRASKSKFLHSDTLYYYAFGGIGGNSGVSEKRACGGYLSNDIITTIPTNSTKAGTLKRTYLTGNWASNPPPCSNNGHDGQSLNFIAPNDPFINKDLGQAGAGGGGGGWHLLKEENAGSGGDGQPGYVYIYWTKID